ncbi:MAG: hypothetical protein R2861_02225 [Desulfobacterales bacterium]
MYDGVPDLDAFEAAMAMSRHPVVYNGDIRSAEDYVRLSRRFPAIHRWMIGRWAMVDPFLPPKTIKSCIKSEKTKRTIKQKKCGPFTMPSMINTPAP